MQNLKKKLIIHDDEKIGKAINKINSSKIKILFVINKKNKLVGSVSSGDIRRSLRKKIGTDDQVKKIMCKKPKYTYRYGKTNFSNEHIISIPVVNKKKQIINFIFSKHRKKNKKNTIFLMVVKRYTFNAINKKNTKTTVKNKGNSNYRKNNKGF